MLHRYKFNGYSGYADVLAELMLMCLRDAGSPKTDAVCWVPSSGRRIYRRGYDQSRRLAVRIAKGLGLPLRRLLVKTRHNRSQSGTKTTSERFENVRGAFAAAGRLGGEAVLLVDDICTTGATLRECARVLRAAGADKVVCLCAARSSVSRAD